MVTRVIVTTLRTLCPIVLAFAMLSSSARAQSTALAPGLAPIAFLLGSWTSDNGTVADTGEHARGRSEITVEAGGAAILRRDHTDLSTAAGKATESFDQIMLIYAEGGTIHADYTDGTHVIHYVSATIVPDRSIAFTSAAVTGAPTYRLSYEATVQNELAVRFEIEPPGQNAFVPIATGTLHRRT